MLTYLVLFLLYCPGHQSSKCDPNPCLHGGHCQTEPYWPEDTPYQCTCLPPWSGKTCNEGGPPIQGEEEHEPISTEMEYRIEQDSEGIQKPLAAEQQLNESQLEQHEQNMLQSEQHEQRTQQSEQNEQRTQQPELNELGSQLSQHYEQPTQQSEQYEQHTQQLEQNEQHTQEEEEHGPISTEMEDIIEQDSEGIQKPLAAEQHLNESLLEQHEQHMLQSEQHEQRTQQSEQNEQHTQEEVEHGPILTEMEDRIEQDGEGIKNPLAAEQHLNESQSEQHEQHTQQSEQYEQRTLQLDPCTQYDCWNTKRCNSNYTQGRECQCIQRWKLLPYCQFDDPCIKTRACRNAGKCESKCKHGECRVQGMSYKCTCEPGWKGPRCNQDINECGSGSYYSYSYVEPTHSCSHHGACINTAGSYRCQCRDGWEGEYCSEMRNCESHPCYNNGTCISLVYPPYTQCRCPTGFTGSQCEVEDFCARNPCINGDCTNTEQGFSCRCFSGYTGVTCEDREDLCITENCNMRGTCREVTNGKGWRTACTCNHGYDGVRCQLDIVRELNRELQRKDVELQRKENELREERRKLWDEKIKVREFENDKSKVLAFFNNVTSLMKDLPWNLAGDVGQTDYDEGSGFSDSYCR